MTCFLRQFDQFQYISQKNIWWNSWFCFCDHLVNFVIFFPMSWCIVTIWDIFLWPINKIRNFFKTDWNALKIYFADGAKCYSVCLCIKHLSENNFSFFIWSPFSLFFLHFNLFFLQFSLSSLFLKSDSVVLGLILFKSLASYTESCVNLVFHFLTLFRNKYIRQGCFSWLCSVSKIHSFY